MANRQFHPGAQALEIKTIKLYAKLTFGGSGAVTLTSGKGIASATKESADGQYTIALSDSYNRLMHVSAIQLHSTDSDPASVGVHTRLNSEQVSHATAPNIVLQCFAGDDGADANPASGAVMFVEITLSNSSVS